jgi:alpha-methylacyl-CoA racemase
MAGPLAGIRVVELAAIGPGPFAGMMLADMGADVIRVDRPVAIGGRREFGDTHQVLDRGRRSIAVDLKQPAGVDVVLDLAASADAFIEGFRPGVAERLGLGPDVLLTRNPRLVYGRMTGWGQDGPRAGEAGHDITYVALSGALEPISQGGDDDPVVPLNMLGDFGGGGLLLAFGIAAALLHAQRTGEGQVIDAAIADGTALFTGMLRSMQANGAWSAPRGHNLFDGGAPYYRTYRTADGKWLAVGAIETRFYAELVRRLGLEDELPLDRQNDATAWPQQRRIIAERIARRTRAEWTEVFAGTDACVAPVLSPTEAEADPHLAARNVFAVHDGVVHPQPAPRLSATPGRWPGEAPTVGQQTREILGGLGRSSDDIAKLLECGAVAGI